MRYFINNIKTLKGGEKMLGFVSLVNVENEDVNENTSGCDCDSNCYGGSCDGDSGCVSCDNCYGCDNVG